MEPFSKSPYKWDKSVKIEMGELDSERDNSTVLGSVRISDKTIFIQPEQSLESKAGTLSHEIAHSKLEHKRPIDSTPEMLQDRFRGLLSNRSEGLDSIYDPEIAVILRNYEGNLQEFEVRILQEEKRYYIDNSLDSFKNHLISELIDYNWKEGRSLILDTALQAITNMQRKGYITIKEAKRFRQQSMTVAKSFGTRSR